MEQCNANKFNTEVGTNLTMMAKWSLQLGSLKIIRWWKFCNIYSIFVWIYLYGLHVSISYVHIGRYKNNLQISGLFLLFLIFCKLLRKYAWPCNCFFWRAPLSRNNLMYFWWRIFVVFGWNKRISFSPIAISFSVYQIRFIFYLLILLFLVDSLLILQFSLKILYVFTKKCRTKIQSWVP